MPGEIFSWKFRFNSSSSKGTHFTHRLSLRALDSTKRLPFRGHREMGFASSRPASIAAGYFGSRLHAQV